MATHGWRLLDDYRFAPETGLWQHRKGVTQPPLSLDDVECTPEGLAYPDRRREEPASRMKEYLEEARRLFEAATPGHNAEERLEVTEDFEHLRWFPLPGEAQPAG